MFYCRTNIYIYFFNQYFLTSCFPNSFGLVQLQCSWIKNMYSLSCLILLYSLRGLLIKLYALYHYNAETKNFFFPVLFQLLFYVYISYLTFLCCSPNNFDLFSSCPLLHKNLLASCNEYSLFIQKRDCSRKFLHHSNFLLL